MNRILSIFTLILSLSFGQVLGQYQTQPFFNQEPKIAVYPNPAREFLYIKSENPNIKIKSVSFYSVLGSLISEIQINANYSEIRVDKLKSGRYLLRYTLSDNSQKTVSIIKQ